jgi:hypothetical protein
VTYYVANAVTPPGYSGSAVLDDTNSSTSNGTGIDLWQFNGGANQEWTFIPLADGNDLIVNVASGLALGDPGYSTSEGTQVIQWQWNGGLNEQWYLSPV